MATQSTRAVTDGFQCMPMGAKRAWPAWASAFYSRRRKTRWYGEVPRRMPWSGNSWATYDGASLTIWWLIPLQVRISYRTSQLFVFIIHKTGTSDEHLSLVEHMAPVHPRLSAVIVTTPQAVALLDAMKCLSFTRATSIPVLGLIENMSGYVCPCCGEISNVFSTGGGAEMAKREDLTFLGGLPVDTELVTLLDAADVDNTPSTEELSGGGSQKSFQLLEKYEKTSTAPLFKNAVDIIIRTLELRHENIVIS